MGQGINMEQSELNRYKEILIHKRERILHERTRHWLALNDDSFNDGELSKYPSSMADEGSDTGNLEDAFLILEREDKYLQEIDQALERIELKTYGSCYICGTEISEERLLAVPTTRFCVSCKIQGKKKNERFYDQD